MKIMHLCLANFYIDGYNYQENVLPRINKEDGHDVRILASTETFVDNVNYGYVKPCEYITEYGVPIKRISYTKIGTQFTTIKIRRYPGVYAEIAAFAPDVIMCHDIVFWSILDVIRYKKEHPEVKLYADTHTAAHNSGTNWLSLHVLHRFFYKRLIQKAIPYLEKYFYIGYEEGRFSVENYAMPEELMEFYPLGGMVLSPEDHAANRTSRRMELGLEDDEILLVHSGKLDVHKRTADLLRAFSSVPEMKAKLVIIGSIPEDMKDTLLPLIEADSRVIYLGWKSSQDLLEYLCACDLYCQPGSRSATMQNAVCCSSPILLFPHDCYEKDYDFGNILWTKTQADIANAFQKIADGSVDLKVLRAGSEKCARELLDYRALAARLYR